MPFFAGAGQNKRTEQNMLSPEGIFLRRKQKDRFDIHRDLLIVLIGSSYFK